MNSTRLVDAFTFAATLHEFQKKKGVGTPYLAHLLGVASIVIENGGTEDEVIAALLHDTVEDQGGEKTLGAIRRKFGAEVAGVVESCSDSLGEPKASWKDRKTRYLDHLKNRMDYSARLVSIADKLYNVRSITSDLYSDGDEVWTRFNAGRDGLLWYFRALADIFLERGPFPIAEELNREVMRLEKLASN